MFTNCALVIEASHSWTLDRTGLEFVVGMKEGSNLPNYSQRYSAFRLGMCLRYSPHISSKNRQNPCIYCAHSRVFVGIKSAPSLGYDYSQDTQCCRCHAGRRKEHITPACRGHMYALLLDVVHCLSLMWYHFVPQAGPNSRFIERQSSQRMDKKTTKPLPRRRRRYHDVDRPTACPICARPTDGFHYGVGAMTIS